jgi:uncharacterized damage-inducible protein DinB
MAIAAALLPEFDHEMANTRKTLERIPEDKWGWKPHEKSMTLGRLTGHLAELPSWAVEAINKEFVDIAPGEHRGQAMVASSQQQALDAFDKNVVAARAALAGASDEHLLKPWTLRAGEKTILTLPRIAVVRAMVMNHMIHHRAQLGVYLRLNDIAVPAIYGPSADEGGF